jgi:hypothetical protein
MVYPMTSELKHGLLLLMLLLVSVVPVTYQSLRLDRYRKEAEVLGPAWDQCSRELAVEKAKPGSESRCAEELRACSEAFDIWDKSQRKCQQDLFLCRDQLALCVETKP